MAGEFRNDTDVSIRFTGHPARAVPVHRLGNVWLFR